VVVALRLPCAAPTLNQGMFLRYVYYSYASYNTPAAGSWSCPYCYGGTTGFVHTVNCINAGAGSFAFVGYNPNYNEIVASFRGSSNIINWIEDLYAIKTPPGQAFPGLPNVQVHAGFWSYYQSLKDCVLTEVRNLKIRFPPILLLSPVTVWELLDLHSVLWIWKLIMATTGFVF